MSLEDLFRRQRQTWASCPEWVQTLIIKNIRETIKAKMEKEHGVQEDRREGFTDDWAAVAAEVQTQNSSRPRLSATPPIQRQTPSNLRIGALAGARGNRFDSQETVTSFDFSQTATRLLSFLDSDPQTPDGSTGGGRGANFGQYRDSYYFATTLAQH
jgi:hypothetical protein